MIQLQSRVLIFLSLITVGIPMVYLVGNKCWEHYLLKTIRETPLDRRAFEIDVNLDLVLSRVQPGMTKQQVEKAVGRPQNFDNEHVWAWAFDGRKRVGGSDRTPVWVFEPDNCINENASWMDMLGAGTMYIVFLDGKVIGMPLGVEASAAVTPSELVMDVRGCDERTAFELLGVASKDIDQYLQEDEESRR